jgi:hypothetical protein
LAKIIVTQIFEMRRIYWNKRHEKINNLMYFQKRFPHDQLFDEFSLKTPENFVNGETFL